ncbi:hypothetical protein [Vreelandella utahensis]|uniref:hypothetical protein n=1 Tax=Vreelandella halophila TaxID=86177 RepID=UPI00117B8954|nr:hypothetical protein [Halomonas utahensis]
MEVPFIKKETVKRYSVPLLLILNTFLLMILVLVIFNDEPVTKFPNGVTLSELSNPEKIMAQKIVTMQDYHSSLITTVYWALGTITTIFIILIGISWLTNFKFYENDKAQIQERIESRLEEHSQSIDARLHKHRSEMSNDIHEHEEKINEKFENHHSSVQENSSEISRLRRQMQFERTKTTALEAQLWEVKGVPQNVALTYAEAVQAAIEGEIQPFIERNLEKLEEQVLAMQKDESWLTPSIVRLIRDHLQGAEDYYPVKTSNVWSIIDNITETKEI